MNREILGIRIIRIVQIIVNANDSDDISPSTNIPTKHNKANTIAIQDTYNKNGNT